MGSVSVNTASSGRVDEAAVCKAVDSLLKWVHSQKSKGKPQLPEGDQFLYLVVSLKKVPERERTNPYRIPLPHPIFALDASREVCLFVDDRDKGVQQNEAKQRILQEVVGITKVIGITKLKANYSSFEAKRKLCALYDLFLADDRILRQLPKLLGKEFSKKKSPIPVKLMSSQWKNQIQIACGSTFLYIGGGTCSVVKVARISQARQEMTENIIAAVEGTANVVPRKWRNIRAVHLKSLESLALPLYQAKSEMPQKIRSAYQKPVIKAGSSELKRENGLKFESKKKRLKRYIDRV